MKLIDKITVDSYNFVEKNCTTLKLDFNNLSNEDLGMIVEYLVDNYEVPLIHKDMKHKLTDKDSIILKQASKAITEITTLEEY